MRSTTIAQRALRYQYNLDIVDLTLAKSTRLFKEFLKEPDIDDVEDSKILLALLALKLLADKVEVIGFANRDTKYSEKESEMREDIKRFLATIDESFEPSYMVFKYNDFIGVARLFYNTYPTHNTEFSIKICKLDGEPVDNVPCTNHDLDRYLNILFDGFSQIYEALSNEVDNLLIYANEKYQRDITKEKNKIRYKEQLIDLIKNGRLTKEYKKELVFNDEELDFVRNNKIVAAKNKVILATILRDENSINSYLADLITQDKPFSDWFIDFRIADRVHNIDKTYYGADKECDRKILVSVINKVNEYIGGKWLPEDFNTALAEYRRTLEEKEN